MKILNQGFDHVEYVLEKIAPFAQKLERMGFEKTGERHLKAHGTHSVVYSQGFVRLILTEHDGTDAGKDHHSVRFLQDLAEGVCTLAIEVDDARKAFQETVSRGARVAREPETFESPHGTVTRAEIWTPGHLRYAFIERKSSGDVSQPALFDEELVIDRMESPSPLGIRVIDHLTNNISMGQTKVWVDYYTKVFGFIITRHFDITTGRTGLKSDVVQSPDFKIKVPINEATEAASQIQEFVNRMGGAGVQHLAFLVLDIQKTLRELREQSFKFLTVPHSYYEEVPARVPGVTENLAELEKLGVLLDGDDTGYLLQIFGEEALGPFFFEYIQRKGNKGFGEGNFKALFQAIERDQIRRGVLKPT